MFRLTRRSLVGVPLLRKVGLILTACVLYSATTYADSPLVVKTLDFPPSAGCTGAASPKRDTDLKEGNQYVLLLFFQTSAASAVHKVLGTVPPIDQNGNAQPQKDGCWTDPGDAQKSIASYILRVQGSCPTDCVKPPVLDMAKSKKKPKASVYSQYPGDPLRDSNHNLWELFFADPNGGDNQMDDDHTPFGVWQIVVADSRQAGRVLSSLYTDTRSQSLFTAKGGYLGHILIGYKPPT